MLTCDGGDSCDDGEMRGKGAYGRALYVLCVCMYSVVLGMLHAEKKKEVVIWKKEAIDLAQRPIFVYVCTGRKVFVVVFVGYYKLWVGLFVGF